MAFAYVKSPVTEFERRVHAVVQRVPRGRVVTYGDVALLVGRPGAARAVGNVMRCNPDTNKTPCHRVVRSDGHVGGYGGSEKEAAKKVRLLRAEGLSVASEGWISGFGRVRWRG
jgi:O-6-methylguanine DNA methyltransferase